MALSLCCLLVGLLGLLCGPCMNPVRGEITAAFVMPHGESAAAESQHIVR